MTERGRREVFQAPLEQGAQFGVDEPDGDTPAVHELTDPEPPIAVVAGWAVVDGVGPPGHHRGEVGGVHLTGRPDQ